MDDENLFDMSDEELEAAYKEAIAQENSPVTDIEENELTEETEEVSDSSTEEDQLDEDQESDSDESSEDSTDEDLEEDSEADENDELDTESDETEEDGSEESDEEEDEEQPAQQYKFKANGKDYEFSSEEIVEQFPKIFGQAMDYTKKMQAIKPWRKTIDAIEQAKLQHEDVNLMIDVLKGDKDAIIEVLKRTGVDTLDLDTEEESKYVPKDYGADEKTLAIKEVIAEISSDKEYATTKNILEKEWDEKSWDVITSTPKMLKALHIDVKNGMFDKLKPSIDKLKVFDGFSRSDIEYYGEAAKDYFNKLSRQEALEQKQSHIQTEEEAKKERLAKAKASTKKRVSVKEASAKRKAAAPTKTSSGSKVVDYLDASDQDFEEWYKNVMDN